MTHSWIAWILLALALFWAVGAYNRLVRLRAQAIGGFVVLDGHLSRYIAIVDDHLKAASGLALAQAAATPRSANPATVWAGLQGASIQFETSLRVARKRPLDAGAMAALQTALATLQMSWSRVREECRDYQDLLSPKGDAPWTENTQNANYASAEFNRAVLAYNAAVTQFPALVLAYLFSFRPAGRI
jgi:LemA protein